MTAIREFLRSPFQRRKLLTILSGTFIASGLISKHVFHLASVGDWLLISAAVIAGGDVAVRAWNALRSRHVSIEFLVTIATVGALAIGEYWEAAAVTFLFIFGAYLEARTMGKTRQALQELLELAPVSAIVLREGEQLELPAHAVKPGEAVLVKPGQKVPVDGVVLDGHGTVDESPITGESMPVEKSTGEGVYAGTVNQYGLLKVRAEGVGADTTLARIIRRVEEAQEEKAPTQRFIERFAKWYTPGIIVLSGVAYLLSKDLALALTLLVIGCPGALVISTPVSVVAGIGRAAKKGILIKGGEYLENAGSITALALDKTGTLTEGTPWVTDVVALHPVPAMSGSIQEPQDSEISHARGRNHSWDPAQEEVLHWAAIAESGSEHPLAQPILEEARSFGAIPESEEFSMSPGRGVQAHFQGSVVAVGNPTWIAELGVVVPMEVTEKIDELRNEGKTAVLVARDERILGVIGVADKVRKAAPEMVAKLKRMGVERIVMLTGDNKRAANAVAKSAGIEEVAAGLLPEDKLTHIRELQDEGHVVAMVGDGVNDSPGLAKADLGIAMGAAGTDVAIETADIALMSDQLMKIPEAIKLSKATLRNIRQNVIIALVTVVVLLSGVLLGKVHMAEGMFIHELSVLTVIFNAMRLMRI
jgi:Cd2+/Zn2+-exporting ATPase